MHRITRLKNGLTVLSARMPHRSSVSLGIWAAVGGRHEPEQLSGISHFIEHLLFKGTRKRTALAISQTVEGVGGYLNAFTSEDNTCFYSRAAGQHYETLLDVLADMYLNPKFDPEEIGKERNVIKEEIAMYLDQPQQHVLEVLNETLWPGHPLGRSITGTDQTLDAIDAESIADFHRSNYVGRTTLIAAAGNLRHRDLVSAVRRLVNHLPMGELPQSPPVSIHQTRPRVRLITRETEQTQLALGIRTCPRTDPRRFALRVLNVLVAENMSSRLWQVLREDQGLTYNVYSSLGFFADDGSMTISAGVETRKCARALELIFQELNRFTERVPSPIEVKRARDYLIGQLDLSLESPENYMMWIAEQFLGYGHVLPSEVVKDRILKVTPSMVRKAAQDFFRPERYNLAMISPLKSADRFKRILTR